jgi:hypothetical protein
LESNAPITSNGEDSNSTVKNATYVYTAQLAPGNSKTYQFTAHRKTDFTGFSARATHSKEDMVISERLQNFTDDVRKLAVVIDGSNAIGSKRQEIVRALGAIPKSVQTKVMVADHRDAVETFSVTEAINRLNNMEYGVREKVPNTHSTFTSYDFPVASRLSTIWAADEARKCAGLGDSETAVLLGTAYRVVTPVTGAVVLEMQSDYQYQNLHRNFYSVVSAKAHAAPGTVDGSSTVDARQMSPVSMDDALDDWPGEVSKGSAAPMARASRDARAPLLQGATNGTVGPQGQDALAIEILGILYGGFCLISGFFMKNTEQQIINKLILGSTAVMIGLATPGLINWLVATARELNLFS